MHLTAFGLGIGSLAVAAIAKATPYEWTAKFPIIKEAEDESSFSSKLSSGLGKLTNE